MDDFDFDTTFNDVEAPAKKPSTGFGIAGFVIGITGIVGCCCYLCYFCFVGLIFSIIQMKKTPKNGLAIAGLVLNIIGILIALVLSFFIFCGEEFIEVIEEYLSTTFPREY